MADDRYDRPALSDTLTARQSVLLVRVMEEAAELQQACAKALRWGLQSRHPQTGQTNSDQIAAEMDDVTKFMIELRYGNPLTQQQLEQLAEAGVDHQGL